VARLPQPGGDAGNWGEILNEFLEVEHNGDGSLKPSGSLAGKYTKPVDGIPKTDLSTSVQSSLDKADASLNEVQVKETITATLPVLTAPVGPSETVLAHGQGYTPTIVSLIASSNARVWQSSPPDDQYIYLTASTSTTVIMTLEQVTPSQATVVSVRNPTLLHLPLRENLIGLDQNGTVAATASGPVRFTTGGYWGEELTTNLIPNPVLATDLDYWSPIRSTAVRDTAISIDGFNTVKLTATAADFNNQGILITPAITSGITAGTTYTMSFMALHFGPSAKNFYCSPIFYQDAAPIATPAGPMVSVSPGVPTRIAYTVVADPGANRVAPQARISNTEIGYEFWMTAFQFEQKSYATSLCHGSLGIGYSWAGMAHESTSTRSYAAIQAGSLTASGAIVFRFTPAYTDFWADSHFRTIFSTENSDHGAPGEQGFRISTTTNPMKININYNGTGIDFNHGLSNGDVDSKVFIFNFEPGLQRLFIDGVMIGETTIAEGVLPGRAIRLPIHGTNHNDGGKYSDLMIFDRPLTDVEREALAATPEWSFSTLQTIGDGS